MGRERGRNVRADQRARAREREALEERFEDLLAEAPELEELVTARGAKAEPFHRWFRYVQGFAPELVRRFLAQAAPRAGPLLDPFSGSGTVVTECARQGRSAVGVDAAPVLAFLARSRFLLPPEEEFAVTGDPDFEALYAAAPDAWTRAGVLAAAATSVDGEGHRRTLQATPAELVRTRLGWMREDARRRLETPGEFVVGDARALPFARAVFGGALTSPPYLSRYDYAKINDPMERLYSGRGRRSGRRSQVRAAPVLARGSADLALPPAAEEAARELEFLGERDLAKLVLAYFADLGRVLAELARTLATGAPCWIVIGGADLKRSYVPSDLILAAMAEDRGFDVAALRIARRLRDSGRRLGARSDVAPRETVVELLRR